MKRTLALFCLAVLLPATLLILGTPLIVRTAWFARGTHVHWVQTLDYPYQVKNANADVVVFGDSSALYGIDPRVFTTDTGRTMENISGSINSLGVMGDKPLAAYMAHNKAPRLVVVYVAPWNSGMPPQDVWPEGVIMMLRNDSAAHSLRYAATHPSGVLNADMAMLEMLVERLGHPRASVANMLAETHGFLPYPVAAQSQPQDCSLAKHRMPADAGAWARFLAGRWQSAGTRVVLYLAPIPGCSDAARFSNSTARTGAIAGPAILPPSMFLGDDFQVHMQPPDVPISTRLLEQGLASALKQ